MTQLRNGNREACYGKKKYVSYYAALRASKQLNKFRDGAKANPYHCGGCRLWHVGNTMGQMRNKPYTRDKRRISENGRI